MEVRLSFTISEHGRDPKNGERFMNAFMETFPEGGPSVSQDTAEGTLTITFALDAKDAKDALDRASKIFVDGANATHLRPTEVLDVEASVVRAEEGADEPTLVPA